jgi:hypothetical protein
MGKNITQTDLQSFYQRFSLNHVTSEEIKGLNKTLTSLLEKLDKEIEERWKE